MRFFIGFILVLLGGIFFVDQLGLVDAGNIIQTFWPVLLILAGLFDLLQKPRNLVWSGILIILGAVTLSNSLGLFEVNIWNLIWPTILVIVGIMVIFNWGEGNQQKANKDKRFSISSVFSGFEYKNADQELGGGEILSVFGGADVDLTKAKPANKDIVIHLSVAFGGAEIKIPKDWSVNVQAAPLLGGIEVTAEVDSAKPYNLIVKAVVMFGGVEIRN